MQRRGERGFSLLEMLVVVTIILILAGMATPSLLRAIRLYRVQSDVRNLANVILRTRYESIRQNRRMGTVCSQPYFWGSRYGIDTNDNDTLDAGEPFVRPQDWSFMFSWAPNPWALGQPNYDNLDGSSNNRIGFMADGTTLQRTSGSTWAPAPTTLYIWVWHWEGSEWFQHAITITPSGRIRIWRWEPVGGWIAL